MKKTLFAALLSAALVACGGGGGDASNNGSVGPTSLPSATAAPTASVTAQPTLVVTATPTGQATVSGVPATPTTSPAPTGSATVTSQPTTAPTATNKPTSAPTASSKPTTAPTATGTPMPTMAATPTSAPVAGAIDAITLTDTTAALYWSGFSSMGERSLLPASDPVNTADHVATAMAPPVTPVSYPKIGSDPSNGVFTIERDKAPVNGWHSYYRAGAVGNHQPVVVSGGSAAAAADIHTCGSKQCIFDAIRFSKNRPKIIRVYGNIDMRVGSDGAFREWTSWDDQKGSSIVIPSNTTLVGINAADGSPARLISAQIEIGKEYNGSCGEADYKCWIAAGKSQESYPGWTRNVIVRNLWIQTNWDVQPEGSADAYYDGMVVAMAQNVWIDRVTITDGQYNDVLAKKTSGANTRHDGALDIVRGSDYVTVSNSAFIDHGKTTLVSNSDSSRAWSDENRFHVTFYGNYYKDTGQRIPRVRWGQVHIFNNYVEGDRTATTTTAFEGGVGMGYKADVLMESTLWNVEPTKEAEACKKITADHGSWISFRQNNTWLKSAKYLPSGLDVTATMKTCGYAEKVNWTPPYSYSAVASPLTLESTIKANAGAGAIKPAVSSGRSRR